MRNRQIPRAEWFTFFDGFTRRHEDWLATLRVLDSRIGAQVEARELPLQGIVADRTGAGPISILLGQRPDKNVEHTIEDPIRVWVEEEEDGAEAALDIESANGTKTILQFRSAVLPETVDGLMRP